MNVWEIAILRIIKAKGGQATTQEIYSELESGKFLTLTADDLRVTIYGGRPAYQHQVRSHLSNLRQSGDLKWVSRGKYSLTKKGRRRIQDSAPPTTMQKEG